MPIPGAFWYSDKAIQSGTGMLHYKTEMLDAGMPMPAVLDSMRMPSYKHSGGFPNVKIFKRDNKSQLKEDMISSSYTQPNIPPSSFRQL